MNSPERLTLAQLIATPGGNWGGMEKHTADLADELARRGHKVHVLAHPDYRHRFSHEITFHPLPVQWGRRNPLLKQRLKRMLRKLSPDVIHAQGSKAAALISGLGTQGSVTVGTVHGTKSSHKDFNKLEGVIAVSKGIREALSHPDSILIHNGVKSQNEVGRTTHPVPGNQAFAVAIGRLEPVKQFGNLISVWATVNPALPLYILGEGSEAEKLRVQVQHLGAESFIKLPGYEENPAAWLQKASVCVISSEREGFPYTLVEALLMRCPVLSTPVNGALEMLPAESLATATDLSALHTLLSAQLADPESLKKSQEACFEHTSRELTLEAMTSRTEAFYFKLLSANSRA
ncbi:MAG: glycosyltransferase involved in cell wall biosynthesis [Marinobacter maritimus]|jgi:glycosyltransferase involved in cell wall biosynthesis|uniref:glycosyltransferase n=1 Tax=Marinobacter maritimus TaxID=277961 RepID=UPI0011A52300|nr:glycosyltransferase [Marinobacter maritimus]MBL1271850.1 glycosyltransferase [Oceanospirillales bacterium]